MMRASAASILLSLTLMGCAIVVTDETSSPLRYNPPVNTQEFRVRVQSDVTVRDVQIEVDGAPRTRMTASGQDQFIAQVPLPTCIGAANYRVIVDGPILLRRIFPRAGRFTRTVQRLTQECVTSSEGFARTFRVNRFVDFPDSEPGDGICAGTDPNGDEGCSLRAAVMEANASTGDDIIQIRNGGRYFINSDRTEEPDATDDSIGDLDITENVTIEGVRLTRATNVLAPPGSEALPPLSDQPTRGRNFVRIDAQQQNRHFHVLPRATLQLRSLALLNGESTGRGGAIRNQGVLSLDRVVLANNTADNFGGAVYNTGTLVANDTVFSRNRIPADTNSPNGGAIYSEASGDITINRTLFAYNSARFGTAVRNVGIARFENVVFYSNEVSTGVGAVINNAGSTFLNHTTFVGNTSKRTADVLLGSAVDTRNSLFYANPQGNCGVIKSAGGNL
ncbi:MAG: hypothetical protein AAF681_13740, partial [Pseudomonadota bacterium]